LYCLRELVVKKKINKILKLQKKKKIDVISIVGFNSIKIKKYAKFHISVNSKKYGIIEDIFHSIMHVMLEI